MPKAAQEADVLFADRCKAQAACEQVIHPYDPKREDQHKYARRLEAHKSKTALAFEPGDNSAVDHAIGPEKSEYKLENVLKKAVLQVCAHPNAITLHAHPSAHPRARTRTRVRTRAGRTPESARGPGS